MNKNAILNSGIYDVFLNTKREMFEVGLDTYSIENYDIYDCETIRECLKIYKSDQARKNRMFEEVMKWLFALKHMIHYQNYKLVFITLTFSDDDLKKTSKQTRRRYVSRFLKEHTDTYIANIDYGEKNGREHYHALAIIKDDIDTKSWGRVFYIEKVKTSGIEAKKTLKYVCKLNNHSFKDSTKREKLIYSRKLSLIDIIIEDNIESYRRFKLKIKLGLE